MTDKAKVRIIDLLTLIFCILLYVGFNLFIIAQGYNPLKSVILSFVGVLINYVITVFVHELGHVITARCRGLKTSFVNFGLFTVDFKKKKFYPFTFFGNHAGKSVFVPAKEIKASDLRIISESGIIFQAVTAALFLIAGVIVADVVYYCMFCIGQVSAIYVFMMNALSARRDGDAAIFDKKSDYAEVLAACYNTEYKINQGSIPTEPELIKRDNRPIALYLHYLFTAVNEGRSQAFKVLETIKNTDELTDDEYAALYPEIVYAACVSGKIESVKARAQNFFAVADDNEVNVLRAHAAFRIASGETQWGEALKKSYDKVLAAQPAFIKLAEQALSASEPGETHRCEDAEEKNN